MAAPTVKIKRSSVTGKIPTTSQISLGEFAVNTTDGKVFLSQESGGVGFGTTIITINPWSVGVGSTTYNTYFTAGNVGVGATIPTTKLEVNGIIGFTGSIVRIGDSTTAPNNTVDNIFIGRYSGYNNITGNNNIFIGNESGYSNTSVWNTAVGWRSLYNNINGSDNQAFGYQAGFNNIGGSYNNFIGEFSGPSNTTGSYNNFFGTNSGNNNISGRANIFLGSYTGISTSASYKIIIGQASYPNLFDSPDTSKNKQFAVGLNTTGTAEYWLVGNENLNIGIGTTNPTQKLEVGGTVKATSFIGDGSGLTGVTASGTAISVQNDGAFSGLATAINFADNLSVTFSSGVARISGFSTTATGILRTVTQYSATEGQTTFAATYVVGYVDVYMNGIRLSGTEYTATNGTSIVLNEGASLGDIIDIVAFSVNLTYTATSGYASSAGISTYATTAGFSTNSGISTNVIGGIGSITQLQVTGVSTFTNGPVLIGGGTSTGTITQRLQVVGVNSGAYVGGNLGIGSTNPQSKLSIVGDAFVSGVTTTGLLQVGTGATIISTTGIGSIGIGTATPTSRVHILGSSTAAGSAPLEISKGTLLTNPENDVFEYDGTNLYHTNNDLTNGFGRAVIPEVQFRRLAASNSVGVAQSSVFGVGVGTFSVLANTLYELDCNFYITKTTVGVVTFTFNVNSGSFVSLSGVVSPLTSGTAGAAGTTLSGGALQGATANNSGITVASLATATNYAGSIKATFIPTANAKFTVSAGTTAGSVTFLPDSIIKVVGYASTLRAGNVA